LDKVYPDTPEFARERALFGISAPEPAQDDEAILDEVFRLKDAGQPIPQELEIKFREIMARGQ
jgi:hypothetical protein